MQQERSRLCKDALRKAPSRRLLEVVGQEWQIRSGRVCLWRIADEDGGPAPQG
jgi:hypothetical protein